MLVRRGLRRQMSGTPNIWAFKMNWDGVVFDIWRGRQGGVGVDHFTVPTLSLAQNWLGLELHHQY